MNLEELAIDCHRKREHYQALGMQNICGLTFEEREKQSVAYKTALAELMKAEALWAKAARDQ
jgi:hypothetical protein